MATPMIFWNTPPSVLGPSPNVVSLAQIAVSQAPLQQASPAGQSWLLAQRQPPLGKHLEGPVSAAFRVPRRLPAAQCRTLRSRLIEERGVLAGVVGTGATPLLADPL